MEQKSITAFIFRFASHHRDIFFPGICRMAVKMNELEQNNKLPQKTTIWIFYDAIYGPWILFEYAMPLSL